MEAHAIRLAEGLRRIQAEYLEMPGLRLTSAQAQRLFGVPCDVCDCLLGALVDEKFLTRTPDGAFIRTDGAAPAQYSVATNVTALGSVA